MQKHKLKEETNESLEFDLITNLSKEFGVENNPEIVFYTTYDWYFVPRSPGSRLQANEKLKHAIKEYNDTGICPEWIREVYKYRTTTKFI